MPLGVTEEHRALADAVRRWAADRCPPAEVRAAGEAGSDTLPAFWADLAAQGWLGLHVPEDHGGAGYSLVELAVVLEELGRAGAPGPFLPTVLAAALVAGSKAAVELAAPLAAGERVAAVGLEAVLRAERDADGGLHLHGEVSPVLGGAVADLLVVGVETGDATVWVAVDAEALEISELPSLDPTRRLAAVRADGAAVPAERVLDGVDTATVRDLAAILLAAEACGVAAWCLHTAAEYAKVREQFGRPIGQFQAVKHRCADMLIAVEQARAVAWDAARAAADPAQRPLAATVAAAVAPAAAFTCAKDAIQILGGIGFTWEHDAHWYLRRATATRQLLGGETPWRRRAAELALAGARRELELELGDEPEDARAEIRAQLSALVDLDPSEQRVGLADGGWLAPHLPAPWGRDADAVEQLVIEEELRRAGVARPGLQIGAWVVPTLIAHGTAEQQQRWIPGTLHGELSWCQLFSEPGAGSDLAALATKAVRADGGWLLTGQKVWTSLADRADFAICLARTNPDAPKREGITYFVLDMRAPGVDVRPLRELTGHAMFNEVFLSDAFIPDGHVVGQVDRGWQVARSTLDNERVAMASGSTFGGGVEALLTLAAAGGERDPVTLDVLGGLVAEGQSVSVLGHRATLHALSGTEPGPTSSVRKLLGVEHEQRVSELGLELLGPRAATLEGDAERWGMTFLTNRCLTIAGGTSEVQRNIIAERILRLPRDPEPPDNH